MPQSPEEMDQRELMEEVEQLRTQRARLCELIGCQRPEKLEHDLRNVLNELALLRKLAELENED